MAGLSANKENYRVLVGSVKNPGKTTTIYLNVGTRWGTWDGS